MTRHSYGRNSDALTCSVTRHAGSGAHASQGFRTWRGRNRRALPNSGSAAERTEFTFAGVPVLLSAAHFAFLSTHTAAAGSRYLPHPAVSLERTDFDHVDDNNKKFISPPV